MNNIKSFIAYLLVVVFVLGSIAASAKPGGIEISAGKDTFKTLEQRSKAGIEYSEV